MEPFAGRTIIAGGIASDLSAGFLLVRTSFSRPGKNFVRKYSGSKTDYADRDAILWSVFRNKQAYIVVVGLFVFTYFPESIEPERVIFLHGLFDIRSR